MLPVSHSDTPRRGIRVTKFGRALSRTLQAVVISAGEDSPRASATCDNKADLYLRVTVDTRDGRDEIRSPVSCNFGNRARRRRVGIESRSGPAHDEDPLGFRRVPRPTFDVSVVVVWLSHPDEIIEGAYAQFEVDFSTWRRSTDVKSARPGRPASRPTTLSDDVYRWTRKQHEINVFLRYSLWPTCALSAILPGLTASPFARWRYDLRIVSSGCWHCFDRHLRVAVVRSVCRKAFCSSRLHFLHSL